MLDLTDLIDAVKSRTTLRESVAALLEGLASIVAGGSDRAELAAALRSTPKLASALTSGTSHIAVQPGDPLIDVVREQFEQPMKMRKAQCEAIKCACEPEQLEAVAVKLANVEAAKVKG